MAVVDLRELASYLVSCSANSLGSFHLAKLDRASQLERNVRDLLRELTDVAAAALLAEFLRHHGEEIIATSARVVPPSPKRSEERKSWEPPFTASNWFFLHGPDPRGIEKPPFKTTDPCDAAHFLTSEQSNFLIAVARMAGSDGWTDRISIAAIAEYLRCSPDRAREYRLQLNLRRALAVEHDEALLRARPGKNNARPLGLDHFPEELRRQGFRPPVIETRKPQPGETQEDRQLCRYKVLSPNEWQRLPEVKGEAPKPRRPLISASCRPETTKLHFPGCGPVVLSGLPVVEVKDQAGNLVSRSDCVAGNLKMRLPLGTPTTLGENAHGSANRSTPLGENAHGSAKASTPLGENAHESAKASTPLGENAHGSAKGSTPLGENAHGSAKGSTPLGENAHGSNDAGLVTKKFPYRGGKLVVMLPRGRRPFPSELKQQWALSQDPEELRRYLTEELSWQVSFEGTIQAPPPRHQALPRLNEPAEPRKAVHLDRGPTGWWDKALSLLSEVVNPHSFDTWFRPTKEQGLILVDKRKVIMVRVPGAPFRKQLQEQFRQKVREALASATGDHRILVHYVDDGTEFVLPGAQPAEQVRKAAAR